MQVWVLVSEVVGTEVGGGIVPGLDLCQWSVVNAAMGEDRIVEAEVDVSDAMVCWLDTKGAIQLPLVVEKELHY